MESSFGCFAPTSGLDLIALMTICYPRSVSVGIKKNQNNLSARAPD